MFDATGTMPRGLAVGLSITVCVDVWFCWLVVEDLERCLSPIRVPLFLIPARCRGALRLGWFLSPLRVRASLVFLP